MKKIAILLVLCSAVISCAPQTRFVWGNYESSLYKYYKNPEQRETYRASLVQAVEKGSEVDKVAPGLLAELGFLALEDGDKGQAVGYFEREMAIFPESRPFLQSVIKRADGGEGSGDATDDPDLVS